MATKRYYSKQGGNFWVGPGVAPVQISFIRHNYETDNKELQQWIEESPYYGRYFVEVGEDVATEADAAKERGRPKYVNGPANSVSAAGVR